MKTVGYWFSFALLALASIVAIIALVGLFAFNGTVTEVTAQTSPSKTSPSKTSPSKTSPSKTSTSKTSTSASEKLKPYDVPIITDASFTTLAKTTCENAKGTKKVLLEFSAPWCSDCIGLHDMKQVGSLKKELGNWDVLVVNIGKFEHHEALLKHFKLKAIADWRILQPPKDCTQPITTWEVVTQRTLEPLSGKPVSVSSLSDWLKTIRTK